MIDMTNSKTESKISIEANGDNESGDIIYIVKTNKGEFEVNCKGDGGLHIKAPAKIMSSAVGGRGEDDGKLAWLTEQHCKSQSETASNILELLMVISE